MTNSQDRFYQLEFKDRPAVWGDVGSNLRIQGLVVGGSEKQIILLLPDIEPQYDHIQQLTEEEWNEFIRRSDDPEILIGPAKIFQRKVRWEISGAIQQKVWVADGFKCVYCTAEMGKAKLTIDHFIPLELGGKNDETNYLTACAACNKKKGNLDPKFWCDKMGLDYLRVVQYLKNRKLP
jgi:5-methylcytosine-specific restriction endonuclease McrA